MSSPTYWFRAKRYGWGWGLPLSWQGWAALAVYLAVVLAPLAMGELGRWIFIPVLIGATAVLVWVSYRKGEPPAWRWGRKS
ncbi:MAG TPA: hypothetical protein VGJ03_09585 [Acidimicrobiales bacterium]